MTALDYTVSGKVATLTMNRPDQANAINDDMLHGLSEALTDVRDNPDIWVAVITGNGEVFSAGHDLKEKKDEGKEGNSKPGAPKITAYNIYSMLLTINKPLIAALNGPCLAQGAGIALNCDIVLASDTAFFQWPQVKRGIMSVSGPSILCRRVPMNIALEILFLGQKVSVEYAQSLGLVNRIVPRAQLQSTVDEYVGTILENAPVAMRSIKEAAHLTRGMPQQEAFTVTGRFTDSVNRTADAQEGLTAFAEKRDPVWTGT